MVGHKLIILRIVWSFYVYIVINKLLLTIKDLMTFTFLPFSTFQNGKLWLATVYIAKIHFDVIKTIVHN